MSDPLTCDNRKDLREWAGVRVTQRQIEIERERNAHKHTQKLDKISKIPREKNTHLDMWVRLRFHSQEPIELTLPINIFTYYLIGLLLLARLSKSTREFLQFSYLSTADSFSMQIIASQQK